MSAPLSLHMDTLELAKGEVAGLLEVGGELDLYRAHEFEAWLLPGNWDPHDVVVVDFTDLLFIDSSAILVLIKGFRGLVGAGKRLGVVVREASAPERVLRLTGLGSAFEIATTREGLAEALGL